MVRWELRKVICKQEARERALGVCRKRVKGPWECAGEDEATLAAVAAAMGVFSRYCSPEEVRSAVRAGGLGSAGPRGSALSSALTLAAVAHNAPAR